MSLQVQQSETEQALADLLVWFTSMPSGPYLEPAINMEDDLPSLFILDILPDGTVYDTVDGEILGPL
ncbi:MAG: hypothetical protein GTO63_21495 [Anaerolineae bacterium]|nr:hypothetical protein [Anaerolineae bacterium]NIQ80281.1 hypothetical protein [Anaerolineae bacterium]